MKKKQQVLIISGGTSFDNYDDYISYLKKDSQVSLDGMRTRETWKKGMVVSLGEDFEVFLPGMPNRMNARYSEWEIWFERIINLLDNNLILIGHSLGGIFLAKYFSENKINKKIKALILIAAPFGEVIGEESLTDFKLPGSLSNLSKQCKNIYLIQSKDDVVVPFSHVEAYKKELPKAKLFVFEDKSHFNQETFPELIKLIKEI
jgi:predicted alpha/beta hydrolase family esterase